jgi:phospholipase C
MLIVSPWSKGGWVNSQVFDHTSVLRFVEQRFGVAEPNISAWRRTVCGDLTSAFDFATPDAHVDTLPDTSRYVGASDATRDLPDASVPQNFVAAAQESGNRPARALPYAFDVACEIDANRKAVTLSITNSGVAGVALNAYAAGGETGPWSFTVEAGKSLRHEVLARVDAYDLMIYGPNGFLRHFRGATSHAPSEPVATFGSDAVQMTVPAPLRAQKADEVVPPNTGRAGNLAAVEQAGWNVAGNGHWYDIEISSADDPTYLRRYAGHIETGAPSVSDPLIGRTT